MLSLRGPLHSPGPAAAVLAPAQDTPYPVAVLSGHIPAVQPYAFLLTFCAVFLD